MIISSRGVLLFAAFIGLISFNVFIIEASDGKPLARYKRQQTGNESLQNNEIEDDRIKVVEPYKSLLETTTRFALAQTKISNHVNLETAMNIIRDFGFMLSKPKVLFKVIKAMAVAIATLTATTFVFPGFYRVLDGLVHDPTNTLNFDRYLANGISERSVIGVISSKTDDALTKVGLNDYSCRERSVCYVGEILKCTFPTSADVITKFASEHFSNSNYKENKYFRAFVSGFVDRNCTVINGSNEPPSCLGSFIRSILLPTKPQ